MRFTIATTLSLTLTSALSLSALAPVLAQDAAPPGAGMPRLWHFSAPQAVAAS
ncbi:hypothetical protein [Halochromatium roseum]|uniref:hypothetical protein n=1 Tax=Halochromatium roseum TaxID=391920 RepID=UPI001912DE15|nr:hypothetical protein [Halochromatium roseum]